MYGATSHMISASRDIINMLDVTLDTHTTEDTLDSMILVLSKENPEFKELWNVLRAESEYTSLKNEDIRRKVLTTCTVVQILLRKWSACELQLETCHTRCGRFLSLPSPDPHDIEAVIGTLLYLMNIILAIGYHEVYWPGDDGASDSGPTHSPPLLGQLDEQGTADFLASDAFQSLVADIERLISHGEKEDERSNTFLVMYRCLIENSRFYRRPNCCSSSGEGNERYRVQEHEEGQEELASLSTENQVRNLTDRLDQLEANLRQTRQDHEREMGIMECKLEASHERLRDATQETDVLSLKLREKITHSRSDVEASYHDRITVLEALLKEKEALLAAKTASIKEKELLLNDKEVIRKQLTDVNEVLEQNLRKIQSARDMLQRKVSVIEERYSQGLHSLEGEIDLIRSELEQAHSTIEVYEQELAARDSIIQELQEQDSIRQLFL
ncbi:hypothetical protein AAF712_012397 [Marasmius tenuissimus]|uniref:Uncharacterized protein n=1 Tax=Marasmius tenuissimus TaxID=585030 RepID=A0ABR2ZIK6_9AGAR